MQSRFGGQKVREPKENVMNRFVSGAALMFGLALLATPEPAGAQWSAAQRAACQGDAQRLCAQSLADPGQLTACMQRNASKVSKGCRTAMGAGGAKKSKKRA
jgi:hypothetical protein